MAPPASSPERAAPPRWPGAALLALAAVLVYLPALRGGFIWDDDTLLTDNPAVKTIDGLYSIWFGNWSVDYIPLTLSSFWLEWHLWGLHAAGYHAVNILLHAANAVLVWRVLLRLGVPGSWLAALLFALHPVSASSVAWIAERKNTLSMLFYLLSLWSFLRSDDAIHSAVKMEKPRRLAGFSLAAFALALLAKSSVAVLPAVLLLVCLVAARARHTAGLGPLSSIFYSGRADGFDGPGHPVQGGAGRRRRHPRQSLGEVAGRLPGGLVLSRQNCVARRADHDLSALGD
jgi:hypothetical protein